MPKNKPCITEDQIREVLEETVMNSSVIDKSEWNFCVQTPGGFYWENTYNKRRIGACLNENGVWEIYYLNLTEVVYIIIYTDLRSISWEGNSVNSILQPHMYDAFVKLSELIKDTSEESKVVDTSERKLISAKELSDFLRENIVPELIDGEFADVPYAPPSITYEWIEDGITNHFGYRFKEDIPHWEIYTSVNENNDDNVNIKIYNEHIVMMRTSSDFTAIPFARMFRLFDALAKEFDLERFDDTEKLDDIELIDASKIPQEVVETETKESSEIKMEGKKDNFEGGAIRYTKTGKGRYDLIPPLQIAAILEYSRMHWDKLEKFPNPTFMGYETLRAAYGAIVIKDDNNIPVEVYIETIINIVIWKYAFPNVDCVDGENTVTIDYDIFISAFNRMLKDLAIHYENGAEKYGVDNWKKGIPETKGERGGSFRDSGLRHLSQMIEGLTDEPHTISAIWNFIGAMYAKLPDACENCDGMKNTTCGKVCNSLKDLQRETDKDDDQDISHLIEDMLGDTVIDLSHPDPDFNVQCFLMGNIHTNDFGIAFNPNDKKDWHIFKKNKVSITVCRNYLNGLEFDNFEIIGMDMHGAPYKLNIERSSETNLDSEFNIKAELYKGRVISGSTQTTIYELDFRAVPKKIPKDLWDRFYYNFLSGAVEVLPI